MAKPRIYQRPKSTMQSGGNRSQWVLDYAPAERERNDPLTGWWGSGDMQAQLRLEFHTQAAAVAYAEANGIAYVTEETPETEIKPKLYADNFRFGRKENWTH